MNETEPICSRCSGCDDPSPYDEFEPGGMMDSSLLLNIVAIVLSTLSLVASATLAWRQVAIMRHSNELPVIFEFTQEVSSAEFQRAEEYLIGSLKTDYSSDLGVSRLPEKPRTAATKAVWYFNMLGVLLALDIIEEPIIIPIFGYRAKRLWSVLEPYIIKEREMRGDYYAAFFEDFICRINDHWPPAEAYNIRLRRLGRDSDQKTNGGNIPLRMRIAAAD